ncbi:MAG TPA: serine hydrolase domain-containing protein [Actinomycetota bacterium]|nr:serine hydrolase domain-containing protein [Actinomycetota bacterium]
MSTSMKASLDPDLLRARLEEQIAKHDVTGAALGVLLRGEVATVAAGVVNLNTGVEATPDTVFEIGSMGKSWTATVVMQLVDEGLVGLDAPVRTYLPDFRVADPEVSESVTIRHLLTHSSGIDGDHFQDTGKNDDALERYVASCGSLGQTHPLGATMSYCNTGYSILGRVIEVLTDKVWDQAMRERLYEPLGLTHTATILEDSLPWRLAVGHASPKPSDPKEVTASLLPRSAGPMGLIRSTVDEVLAFARLHLDGGRGPDGKQILSAETVSAMQQPQVEVPDPYTLGSHWGLGWILFDWDGHRLYGHDGNTLGQSAFLRIVPEADLAITLLTNARGGHHQVYEAIYSDLLTDLVGARVPAIPTLPATPPDLDLARYAGTYERLSVRLDLAVEDGGLAGTVTLTGPLTKLIPEEEWVTKLSAKPIDETTFLFWDEGEDDPNPGVFYDFEDGVPRFLHTGARTHPRVEA